MMFLLELLKLRVVHLQASILCFLFLCQLQSVALENAAFVCCENLGFINIPSTVSYVGKFAFGKTILKDQIKLEIIKRFGKEVFE